MDFNRSTKYWLPVILWMAFIFWMSTVEFGAQNTARVIEPIFRFLIPGISQPALDVIHEMVRKAAHLTEYFILGALLFRAFRADSNEPRMGRWAILSILVVALYASSDEIHQIFVPGRTPSPIDVGIDIVGGSVAQWASAMWLRRTRRLAAR